MTLQQAQALNNKIKGATAWVYDRFKAIENTYEQVSEGDGMNEVANKMQKFAIKFYAEQQVPNLIECWVIQRIEDFDSQEQIDFLISKGEFFYIVDIEKHLKDKTKAFINSSIELARSFEALGLNAKKASKAGAYFGEAMTKNVSMSEGEIILSGGVTRNPSLKVKNGEYTVYTAPMITSADEVTFKEPSKSIAAMIFEVGKHVTRNQKPVTK